MRGVITKIILENFITYEHVELTPGKSMNMLIGPNGSGKSSVLCGICLGLGGKPSSIGRVTKVGEYVKTGCNEAMIHIELDNGGREILVTRQINKSGHSTWSMNGKTANQKQVEEMVAGMSIHMDNLCQFLSQERVQDFSKMNSKDLLINTEKTVGSSDMYNYHQRLINMCRDQQTQEKSVAALTASLGRESQRCEELRVRMESMTERLEILEKIKNLKSKKPWLKYNEHLVKLEDVKKDFKIAGDELHKRKKALDPVQKSIEIMSNRLKQLKNDMKTKSDHGASLQKTVETQDKLLQALVVNNRNLTEKIRAEENRLLGLKVLEQKLASCEEELQTLQAEYNPAESQRKAAEVSGQLQQIDLVIQGLHRDQGNKNKEITECDNGIRELDYERGRISSSEQKRWTILQRMDTGAFKASKWVTENREQFKGLVYGSIMLEINTREPSDSRYLDILISNRDKKALLCELVDDMNRLVPMLKNQGWKVNMLQAANQKPDNATQVSRKELKQMGFDKYVTDLFTCPLPIFNYLCRSSRLHQIPVAAVESSVNIAEAQKKFSRFFAGDKLFQISQSKYSGNFSTKVIPLGGSDLFASGADPEAIQKIDSRKQDLSEKKQQIYQEMQVVQNSLREQETVKEQLRKQRQQLKQAGDKLKEATIQRDRYRARINDTNKKVLNIEAARAKCKQDNQELVRKCGMELPKLSDMLEQAYIQQTHLSLLVMEEQELSQKQAIKEQELNELRSNLRELERHVENLKKMVEDGKREGRKLLAQAKEVTGSAPGDREFEKLQKIFAELPDTVNGIECAIKDQEGRLEFTQDDDENIVEVYESQQQKVETLKEDLAKTTSSRDGFKTQMTKIKEKWLPDLRELTQKISSKFERLFEYMKCVGEVALVEPAVETEYENYGLQIRVKFRSEEALQDLCGTQSGGERSVSTAIYLLALQELTQVPFRCMDEINQGMDPTNERRIMNLMMKMSELEDSCQYFVVTPKLLPHLQYAKTAQVMCVCQPQRMDTSKWTMAKFINMAKRMGGQKKIRLDIPAEPMDDSDDD